MIAGKGPHKSQQELLDAFRLYVKRKIVKRLRIQALTACVAFCGLGIVIVYYAYTIDTSTRPPVWVLKECFRAIEKKDYDGVASCLAKEESLNEMFATVNDWDKAMKIGGGYDKLIIVKVDEFSYPRKGTLGLLSHSGAFLIFQVIYNEGPVYACQYSALFVRQGRKWKIAYLPPPDDFVPGLPRDPDFH